MEIYISVPQVHFQKKLAGLKSNHSVVKITPIKGVEGELKPKEKYLLSVFGYSVVCTKFNNNLCCSVGVSVIGMTNNEYQVSFQAHTFWQEFSSVRLIVDQTSSVAVVHPIWK